MGWISYTSLIADICQLILQFGTIGGLVFIYRRTKANLFKDDAFFMPPLSPQGKPLRKPIVMDDAKASQLEKQEFGSRQLYL